MAEDASKRTDQSEAAGSEPWNFIPRFIERMLGRVESFVERVTRLVEERTHGLIRHILLWLFGLLLLGVGTVFLLLGLAQVIDETVHFPGMGQVIVGALVLLGTGSAMFFARRRP